MSRQCCPHVPLSSSQNTTNPSITLWHKSLFGYNHPGQGDDPKQNYNTNEMVNPLRANDNYTTKQWFAHGALEYHPVSNQFMELEVGKPNRFELACNRAFTAEGNPDDKTPKPPFACKVGVAWQVWQVTLVLQNCTETTMCAQTLRAVYEGCHILTSERLPGTR